MNVRLELGEAITALFEERGATILDRHAALTIARAMIPIEATDPASPVLPEGLPSAPELPRQDPVGQWSQS